MENGGNLVTFGQFLRQRRKEIGLTQTELGARIGWAQERVSVLENGKYGMPSLPQLCRLAGGLQVRLEDLLRHLGLEEEQGVRSDGEALSAQARLRLNLQLHAAVDQMRVVEKRLHTAEDQMASAEALRASIREQRERMGTLLDSCRDL